MATNFAKADYQEIIDLHTEADKVSIIGIHTPVGSKPRAMLSGFFTQFRKYKYTGCDLVMVPAARLPADPLSVSYEAGEPGTDPRDLLNPILFHGCHGDNLNTALDTIYKGYFSYQSSSVGLDDPSKDAVPVVSENLDWEAQYYRALSDPTFTKSNVMSAFRKKGLHPLVYNVATAHQIQATEDRNVVGQIVHANNVGNVLSDETTFRAVGGTDYQFPRLMTNRLQSLGWLDTKQMMGYDKAVGNTVLPKVFMGMLMLPPAYKTEMYFRLVLTHHFVFKEFNTSLSNLGAVDYSDWNNDLSRAIKEKENGIPESLELVNSTATVATEGVF